ncbi:DUF72 domain-containing protein [Thiohalophilus sp.]|uniref:DUF72 domain-containing protein n=1 Tax=Thiohalophilus sp. TaxID=3028392 RepID=UPI003975AE0F
MRGTQNSVYIGTSGWSYGHWQGPFYPENMSSEEQLKFYAEEFSCVEINNSFYKLPDEKTLRHWRNTVTEDFLFTVKASRYITHMKKIKDSSDSVTRFLKHISVLQPRLGPVLFQLPPNWKFNEKRLSEFLASLSREFRYTFEFRDRSWLNPRAYEILAKYDTAFCIYDFNGFLSPREVTTDFVYIRLHGPGDAYEGEYDKQSLAGWAGAISSWSSQGKDVFCFFDNDQSGYAPLNARSLKSMIQ